MPTRRHELVAEIQKATPRGLDTLRLRHGVVQDPATNGSKVRLKLSAGAATIELVKLASYTPSIGHHVVVLQAGTDMLVIGNV